MHASNVERLNPMRNANRANPASPARAVRPRAAELMRGQGRGHQHHRHRHRGAALPVVLMLISMMLMASSAALEASIAATRRASNLQEHLRAARAADTALELCVRALTEGNAPVLAAVAHEPVEWQNMDAQDEAVLFTPLRSWPGSARSPQCLIEAWCPVSRPLAQAYQVTARGFGASETAQVWLQLTIVEEAGVRKRHWRRIAEPPR